MQLTRDNFERLALEHLDAVYRVATTLARNSVEAEDLAQETYVRALEAADGFELREYGIKPWLLRILHNVYVTRSKREARQPKAVEDEHLHAVASADSESTLPGGEWEANEELAHAMEQLTPDLRMVLTLWSVDELSYKEIAEVMEVPMGTVMSRLHRARQRLRELLEAASGPAASKE